MWAGLTGLTGEAPWFKGEADVKLGIIDMPVEAGVLVDGLAATSGSTGVGSPPSQSA
jgi:hypothetical protein